MTIQQRITVLTQLGAYLRSGDEFLKAIMHRTEYNNRWLTVENCERSAKNIAKQFLQKELLENWAKHYKIQEQVTTRTVGIVLAGNTPLAGFHDLLAVFLSGHNALIKLSADNKFLLPHLIKMMGDWDERTKDYFKIVERLTDFDAVIATGSPSSFRYFEQYFGQYPNIIRKDRKAIAVLDGTESMADLYALGSDVFAFFGLGNRNVSKIYIPRDFQFEPLLEAFHEYKSIVLNTKYKNNFDYNYAMFMLNKIPYKANGCIILIENEAITSRIASLHYEFYDKADNLVVEINRKQEEIQCVVSKMNLSGIDTLSFGKAEQPSLMDYINGIDTMEFLTDL